MNISFIGMGIMGLPMSKNLHESGYLTKVYNRTKEKAEYYNDTNVKICDNLLEVSEEADVIFIMVSDSKDVEEVILGEDGVINKAKKNSIIVDLSSINPEVTKKIGEELKKKDIEFVDAPVSGGEKGAIEGKLSIMVGGEEETIKSVMPYLEVMGGNVTHVGALGSGGYTKIVNQIIVAVGIQSIAEAFHLAQKSDLDFEVLYNAIRNGLAGSNVLDQKINNLIDENFEPGFKIKLHLKDLNNALKVAEEKNVELPVTSKVKSYMEDLNNEGMGELDHSSLYKYISEK